MHGVPSAAIMDRITLYTILKHIINMEPFSKIKLTLNNSCINTRGKMYDSSVIVWSNE